jgi:hypothetical protein
MARNEDEDALSAFPAAAAQTELYRFYDTLEGLLISIVRDRAETDDLCRRPNHRDSNI